ncbi:hypothetical protein GTP38_11125 [Duganella sp. FT94W]|uniref:Uncharacterized protein n=1 Tax=Duganella lactea TaxID=2692173 RepID=A0ABW9V7H1_9BURK|nr:hypothetical protein [Duganella lactea]MYM34891.1 hypothetical protein [Duganella lactea]
MIALILGLPSAAGLNVVQLAADHLAAPRSHLQLVKSLPVAKGENGMQTVAELCAARGVQLLIADMNRIGRRAASLSRKQDLQPVKVACPLFGEVNSYRADILALAWGQIEAEPK